MKVWQKLFLYTMILVTLSISATSILLLKNSFQLTMNREKEAAYTEHKFLLTNFKSLLLVKRLERNAILLEKKQVVDFMESTFEEEDVENGIGFYDREGTFVYCNPVLRQQRKEKLFLEKKDSIALLRKVEETRIPHMKVKGNSLYILSREELEENIYYFLTTTDISPIMTMYQELLQEVYLAGIFCTLLIMIVIAISIKVILRPLQKINEGTRAIAQGEYNWRVPEKGKDELSELAKNMNRMAYAMQQNVHALENLAEDRKTFINNFSHEIKTPLTSILGFSDLLLIRKDMTKEQRIEYVGIIKEEASRMRALSGKLMEMITIGEEHMEWNEEDMQNLFQEIVSSLTIVAESQEMHLSLECEKGKLFVDKELVKSLVYNLVDNAIKASKSGDTIEIKGWFERNVFFFWVKDTGIGIPQEKIKKLTQAFYMVDKARSRARGGAGLGLALCEEISKIHGGNLYIESVFGKGTTITVQMKGGKTS